MRHLGLALALLILTTSLTPSAAGASDCQFVLGFKTLHDLIPDIAGSCVEDQHFNPVNEDALQQTTGGLLVWRKADNFTAFTDGFRSWVNGPFGVQERLNSQRLWWEWNPDGLDVVPTPAPGDRCHTSGLSLSQGQTDAGAGHQGLTYIFTNNLAAPCTFYGYPGAQMLDAQNNPLPTNVIRGSGYLFPDPGPALVTVQPGGSATFGLEWEVIPVGNETVCPQASLLKVTPPDEFDSIIVPTQMAPCGGGTIHVTAVQPGS